MKNRVNINATQPQAYKAMYALERYLETTQLSKTHKELVKIRASQINGCAFCIDMHTKDALQQGETIQRIVLLDAWRETKLFTAEERVVLAVTEAVTLIHKGGISDELYQEAENVLGSEYVAQLIMAIATINAWNRIAISTHLQPGE
ncbi:carboxymuconolactone decarboxylase family protein [Dyadobacter sp. CY326]|uniref:carboxymuconolactone decarboxylase family protein n=1 Tax=Dyadobacter sp. CY326 TaxID=2907300 RepID=UPI001F2E8C25|nr:carboxymuconolactone decarboxylase family protein [Dyadobacter sp. CY326]MCE7063877.1 carboxymuconolactone decarboxylase family protein [Dyadobacter sp. CY326]